MAPGESSQVIGYEGVQKAKRWLERTGRVDVYWTVYEQPGQLTVPVPSGLVRSFDLGGIIRGGDLNGDLLYAECKRVAAPGTQGAEYWEFLANCYCMVSHDKDRRQQFMWITWHPFNQTKWVDQVKQDEIRAAMGHHCEAWLGEGTPVDDDVCRIVAERLWVIVLSVKQEDLVMSDEMFAELRKQQVLATRP